MKMIQSIVGSAAALLLVLSMGAVLHAQEKKAEKAKAQKVAGDIGLLDTEKTNREVFPWTKSSTQRLGR